MTPELDADYTQLAAHHMQLATYYTQRGRGYARTEDYDSARADKALCNVVRALEDEIGAPSTAARLRELADCLDRGGSFLPTMR